MLKLSPPAAAALLLAPLASPQGTAADYERAAGLRERFAGLDRGAEVSPRWVDGETLWWVDGEELCLATVEAKGPRVQRVPFEGGAPVAARSSEDGLALLSEDGRTWRLQGERLALWPARELNPFALAVRPGKAPRSRDDGGRVSSWFENLTEEEVDLFWVDRGGRWVPYGQLAAGERRPMGSFNGHVFGLRRAGTEVALGWVRLPAEGGLVRWDGEATSPAPTKPPKGPAARTAPAFGFRVAFEDGAAVLIHPGTGRQTRLSPTADAPVTGDDPGSFGGPVLAAPGGRPFVAFRQRIRVEPPSAYIIDSAPASGTRPRLESYPYRRPGDPIDETFPVIVRLFEDGRAERVAIRPLELIETPWSLRWMHWSADGSELRFYVNHRGHRRVRVVSVDAATGQGGAVIEEAPETFVCYSSKTEFHRFPVGPKGEEHALWMTERSGWNHLILVDLVSGEVLREVTSGEFVVRSVVSVDDESRSAIVKVMGLFPDQDPYHVHWAHVDVDTGAMTMLTEGDGTHELEFAPGGRAFLDRWSRVDLAPVTELGTFDPRTGKVRRVELARGSTAALESAGWRAPERFVAKGRDGETDIWGVVYRPTNHDPSRKYPVVEQIYAGPHGHFVPKSFRVHRKPCELAELGFIVVQIDGMGTNWRSKAFQDVAWRNLHDSGFPDRKLWLRALGEHDPSVDLSRVGIFGGSAGGQSAMRALIDHGDTYHVAVADCGCHDNRVDKIWWNEQWMGWPLGEHYSAASNVDQAHRMEGKLMLIVGELDRNVDPASTMQVVDALVRADKDFDLLVLPGVGHGAADGAYGTRRRRDFLVRHLLGVEPRVAR